MKCYVNTVFFQNIYRNILGAKFNRGSKSYINKSSGVEKLNYLNIMLFIIKKDCFILKKDYVKKK